MLKNITGYPFDLFKIHLEGKQLADLVEENVLALPDFLDSRIQRPSFLTLERYSKTKIEIMDECDAGFFTWDRVWINHVESFTESTLLPVECKDESEKLIELHVLDLAGLH